MGHRHISGLRIALREHTAHWSILTISSGSSRGLEWPRRQNWKQIFNREWKGNRKKYLRKLPLISQYAKLKYFLNSEMPYSTQWEVIQLPSCTQQTGGYQRTPKHGYSVFKQRSWTKPYRNTSALPSSTFTLTCV